MKKAIAGLLAGVLASQAAAQGVVEVRSVRPMARGTPSLSLVYPLTMPFQNMLLGARTIPMNLGLSAQAAPALAAPRSVAAQALVAQTLAAQQPAALLPLVAAYEPSRAQGQALGEALAAGSRRSSFISRVSQDLRPELEKAANIGTLSTDAASGLGRKIESIFTSQPSGSEAADAVPDPDRMVVFLSFQESWSGTLEDHVRHVVRQYDFRLDRSFEPGKMTIGNSRYTTVRGTIPRGNLGVMSEDGSVFAVTPTRSEAKFRDVDDSGRAPVQLRPGAWTLENYLGIVSFLEHARSIQGRKVAVFDFDHTSILGDVGVAAFHYMVDYAAFAFDAILGEESLWAHFRPQYRAGVTRAIRGLLEERRAKPGQPLQSLSAYEAYRTAMRRAYDDLCDEGGKDACYAWVAQLMAGKTPEEIRSIARETLRNDPSLRPNPGIQDLMGVLRQEGFETWVVSATGQHVVEVAASELFQVPYDRVVGTRLQEASSVLTSRVELFAYRAGKVSAIEKHIGARPLLVAGDSEGDWEMLEHSQGLRLVIDRQGGIANRALEEKAKGGPWLVQSAGPAVQIARYDGADERLLDEVVSIQQERQVIQQLIDQGQKESDDGFLISAYTKENMKSFLAEGGQLYLALSPERKVVGYLLAYPAALFRKNHTKTAFQWLDEQSRSKHQPFFPDGDFIYLDQVGVASAWQGLGVARQLERQLERSLKPGQRVITAVIQRPVANRRSTRFFERAGFRHIGSFTTPNWKNLSEVFSLVFAKEVSRPASAKKIPAWRRYLALGVLLLSLFLPMALWPSAPPADQTSGVAARVNMEDQELRQDILELQAHPNPVLRSLAPVLLADKNVRVNRDKIREMMAQVDPGQLKPSDWRAEVFIQEDSERTIDFFMIGNSLNFKYWHTEDPSVKYTTQYRGKTYTGAYAMWAALRRALDDGIPILDADYLSQLTLEDARRIFAGSVEMPMLEERLAILREVGSVLKEKYGGHFSNLVKQAHYRAFDNGNGIVERLARDFPSFNDVSPYRGHTIIFWKRAQLAVAMLYYRLLGTGLFDVPDIDDLSGFTDYVVPNGLRHKQNLEYAEELSRRVDHRELIEKDSEYEVAIRAKTAYAMYLQVREFNRLRREVNRQVLRTNSPGVDYFDWSTARKLAMPHHLTVTTAY